MEVKGFKGEIFKKVALKISLSAVLLCTTGCFTDAPTRQIDQSVQGLYDSALSSNGKLSLIASIHHGASVWRTKDGERIYNWNHTPGEFSQIQKVALAKSGRIGITAFERELVAWNSKDGKPIEFWELPDNISCLSMNKSGSYALVGMDSGRVMVIDIQNNGFIWRDSLSESITACHLGETQQSIVLGTQSGEVQLFSVRQKQTPATEQNASFETWTATKTINLQHPYAINHVKVLPKAKLLVSGSRHHEFWFTDIKSQETVHTLPLKSVSITHSIESKKGILLADTSRRIQLINTDQWVTTDTVHIPKRNQWKPSGVYLSALAYSKDTLYATGSDGVTYIYENAFD